MAAGKGTRMKSSLAKVLHEVFYAPMIHHVLDSVAGLGGEIIVVTGHQREKVEAVLKGYDVVFVNQEQQLGTGHAVLCAEHRISKDRDTVMILCGDTPLIRKDTLSRMLASHAASGSVLTIMTTILANPTNYGRIITGESGSVLRIVEEKDASEGQKQIKEINAGIYCVAKDFLFKALGNVDTDNKQGEFYLTDIVRIAQKSGYVIERYQCDNPQEVLGVNSRVELAQAHNHIMMRRNEELMLTGVTLIQPETVIIEKKVTIGCDTVIHPNVHLTGGTAIGSGCVIKPFCILHDCSVGDNVKIGPYSFIEHRVIADNEEIHAGTR